MYRRLAFIAIALLAVASPSFAQVPVSVNIGGGVTWPYSDAKHSFGTGGNFQFGADVRVSPMVKVQVQYGYIGLGSKTINATTGAVPIDGITSSISLTANHTNHAVEFNGIFGPALHDRKAAPYGIAGLGYYHEIVNVTTPAVGYGTVCDPWIYICYPALVPIDQILGQRTANDFGINLGGGIAIKMTDSAQFYTEVKYVHTYGPTITNAVTGASVKANGNYIPWTFGIRFHSAN